MLNKKNKNTSRNPRIVYNKQQSYHYSSKRSPSERRFNRQDVSLEDTSTKKNKKSFVKYLPSYLAVALILLGLYYILTLSSKPNVVALNDNSKTQLISKDMLADKASKELNSSILYRFKPTFDHEKLESKLQSISPEIRSVNVETSFLRHRVLIEAEFSEPSVVLSNGSNLYVLGSDGYVLADITKSREGFVVDNLIFVQDESNIEIEVGKKTLTSDQVNFIKEVDFQSRNKGVIPSSMILKSAGSQLDVKYAGLKYYVKYNFFEDARKSSGVFLAIKERLEAEGQIPLEYVDVRVPERAYIK